MTSFHRMKKQCRVKCIQWRIYRFEVLNEEKAIYTHHIQCLGGNLLTRKAEQAVWRQFTSPRNKQQFTKVKCVNRHYCKKFNLLSLILNRKKTRVIYMKILWSFKYKSPPSTSITASVIKCFHFQNLLVLDIVQQNCHTSLLTSHVFKQLSYYILHILA